MRVFIIGIWNFELYVRGCVGKVHSHMQKQDVDRIDK